MKMSFSNEAQFLAKNGARRALVVVGMHRSGTSAMTRMLSLLGAALPEQLMNSQPDNPGGFWEPQQIADLNDEILRSLDSDWHDVFAFRPKPYLSNFDGVYVARAVNLLENEFSGSEMIVLKDPRVSVLTAFWDRALRSAGYTANYIIMVRNPLEVAESLRVRDGFPREKSLLLWSSYMLAVERDTRALSRTFVSYDDLIRDWRGVRSRLEITSGVPFPRDTAAAANEIDGFLDPELRHHVITGDHLFSREDVPQHLKTLYRLFSVACDGLDSGGGTIDCAAIDTVHAELSNVESIIGPLVADLRTQARFLEGNVIEAREAHLAADGRARSLAEELAAERTGASDALSRVASERDVLAADCAGLNARLNEESDLRQLQLMETAKLRGDLSLRESELTQRQEEIEQARAELSRAHARMEELRTELFELQKEAELLRSEKSRWDERKAELEAQQELNASTLQQLRRTDAELAEQKTNSQCLTKQLRTAESDLKRAKERVSDSVRRIDELVSSLQVAQSASGDLEKRLSAHFHETVTLSKIVLEAQQATDHEAEKARRILELYDAVNSQPWWWAILPSSRRSRLQTARLSRLGVFDVQSYLGKNPDVAEAGEDPLHHYTHHGIDERRAV
jgi:hypothetical protein